MRPREIRDMGKEKLNSRALVERDAKIGSTHRGRFRIGTFLPNINYIGFHFTLLS